jgi:predicted Zn-dependent peptidase
MRGVLDGQADWQQARGTIEKYFGAWTANGVGNAVLGGGFYSTRLSIELRKKSGLVYSANSILQVGRTRGAYYIEYACYPMNVGKASNRRAECRNKAIAAAL